MSDRSDTASLGRTPGAAAATLGAASGRLRSSAPASMGGSKWIQTLNKVRQDLDRDHVSVMAAGVAFYSFLSIFPAMSALISVYGLLGNPAVIERQIVNLSGVLPATALELLSAQLEALIAAPQAGLGIGLLISLPIAFWSAMSGVGTFMQALTVAYEEDETRGMLAFYGQTAALTACLGVFGVASLFLIAVAPVLIAWLPLPSAWQSGIALIRWPILAGLVFVALAVVYRFAPSRAAPCWHWLAPGTIAAALLWLLGSAGFSFYVSEFASYNKTYGSLGAVVVLLMWLYVSAYIMLAGAELNAEWEKTGRPAGPAVAR